MQVFVCFLSYKIDFVHWLTNLETVCTGGAPHQKNVLVSVEEEPYHLGKRTDSISPLLLQASPIEDSKYSSLFLAIFKH